MAVQWKAGGRIKRLIEQALPRWQCLRQIESLVVRSHQRCGRITVPRAAIAQINVSMTRLANKKKPPLRSCMERGTMFTTSCYSKCTTSRGLPSALASPGLRRIALAELMKTTGAQAHPRMIATIPIRRRSVLAWHVERMVQHGTFPLSQGIHCWQG